jgi:hypothetical protein
MMRLFALLDLIPGGSIVHTVLGFVWSAVVAVLRWTFADWRQTAIVGLVLVVAQHALRIEPTLRARIDAAQVEARSARQAQTAAETTVGNLKAASQQAQVAQAANLTRVKADQAAITERTVDDYQARLAALRARAAALAGRLQGSAVAGNPGLSGTTNLPRAGTAASGTAGEAPDHGLPAARSGDGLACNPMNLRERLVASEQASQLDTLIDWAIGQSTVRTTP